MKQTLRRLTAALLCVAMLCALTACGCAKKTDTLTVRYLNFKPEIAEQYEALAAIYQRQTGVKVIVETALKEDIEAVGLSALMTTTLASMEETIALLRKEPALQNADGSSKVNVMVGGAVVTPDYAERIGADFYCRDAKATVDACKSVFKN